MCGINGIFSKKPSINPELITIMNKALIHRGPDEEGVFYSQHVALGMRRLSIIDLRDGKQPIYNEDHTLVIVFNGEIYNFRELRENLIAHGHQFKTKSDTEVIIHLYEEYGAHCIDHLNGMFSFAIYNVTQNTLFLARDRLGKKPLYYCIEDNCFMFSSELKSLIQATKGKRRRLSPEAINLFFSLTFIPAPFTIYENIFKLPAAHSMTISSDLSVNIFHYWDLCQISRDTDLEWNKSKCITRIRDLVFDAVRIRMIADVPFGAFLSGGIDSSIIVALMSQIDHPINTFTIGNHVKAYDETHLSRLVAQRHKTNHTESLIEDDYLIGIIPKVLSNFDEPFADSSAFPMFIVSEVARKKVTVALTGDGGDELFGGYSRYLIYRYLQFYRLIPSPVRKHVLKPLINSISAGPQYNLRLGGIRKIINNEGKDSFEQYHSLQRLGYSQGDIDRVLNFPKNPFFTTEFVRKVYDTLSNESALQKAMYTDIMIGLEGDMLAKVDRASMQNSLETRCPFLDYRLVEFSFQIPTDFKIRGFSLKHILKESFKNEIPKPLLHKQKTGFGIPIGEILKKNLKNEFIQILSKEPLNSLHILNKEYIQSLHVLHCKGIDRTFQLWPAYVFALWIQEHADDIATE